MNKNVYRYFWKYFAYGITVVLVVGYYFYRPIWPNSDLTWVKLLYVSFIILGFFSAWGYVASKYFPLFSYSLRGISYGRKEYGWNDVSDVTFLKRTVWGRWGPSTYYKVKIDLVDGQRITFDEGDIADFERVVPDIVTHIPEENVNPAIYEHFDLRKKSQ